MKITTKNKTVSSWLYAIACIFLGVMSHVASADYLTPVAGSPFGTGSDNPGTVVYSPDNTFLAAANQVGNTVSMFSIDALSGELAFIANTAIQTPFGAAFSPISSDTYYLAVADYNDGEVAVFLVHNDGSLTAVTGSPFSTGGTNCAGIAYAPNNSFLAAVNPNGGGSISMFTVNSDGSLTTVAGSPFATGNFPSSVAYSPDSEFIAITSFDSIFVYSVNGAGALTEVGSYATAARPFSFYYSPDGKWAAAGNSNGTVNVFSVNLDGSLTNITGSPFTAGGDILSVAYSPDGIHLVAADNMNSKIYAFAVNSDGSLIQVTGSPFNAGGTAPASVTYSPNDKWVASANMNSNNVSVFATPTIPVALPTSVTTAFNTPITITLTAINADAALLTFSIVTGPTNGILGAITQPGSGGTTQQATVLYTPNADYSGSDSFTFKVTNDGFDSNTATASITVSPPPPPTPSTAGKACFTVRLIEKYNGRVS